MAGIRPIKPIIFSISIFYGIFKKTFHSAKNDIEYNKIRYDIYEQCDMNGPGMGQCSGERDGKDADAISTKNADENTSRYGN